MPTARSSDSRAPAKYPRAGSDRISLPQCLDETQNHSHHPGILGVSRCPIMDQPEIAYRAETLAEPNNIRARQAAGTVHVHPNGRFLYGANCADATVEFRASKSSKAVKQHRGVRDQSINRRADPDPAHRDPNFTSTRADACWSLNIICRSMCRMGIG